MVSLGTNHVNQQAPENLVLGTSVSLRWVKPEMLRSFLVTEDMLHRSKASTTSPAVHSEFGEGH